MKTSFGKTIGWLALLVAVGTTGCGHNKNVASCNNTQTDAAVLVSSCTAAIDSGRLGDADLANAYLGRARGYMIQQDYSLAIGDLDTLLHKQPDNVEALGFRGGAHAMKREYDLAYSDYLRQTQLAPNSDQPWIDLGEVYEARHEYPKAEESFGHAISLRSDNAVALNARCWVRAIVGRHLDEALEDCNRSLRTRPDDANTLNNRGFVHFRKQQYAEAIADFNAAIDHDPKLGSAYYLRGVTRGAMGQVTDSSDLARGRSLDPGVADRYAGYGIPAVR